MNLVDHIQNDNLILSKKASTNGGEYKGPCPWCGGRDRFTVWPVLDRYICRQCIETGDSIEYLKEYRGLTYKEACIENKDNLNFKSNKSNGSAEKEMWEPRTTNECESLWMDSAETIAFESHKYLCSEDGYSYRVWLANRGINTKTIKKSRLGWLQETEYHYRHKWGLDEEIDVYSNKPKKIWLPSGLVIPFFINSKVIRLRIRQANPRGKDKYIIVTGSNTSYMTFSKFNPNNPCIICESELDGWYLDQTTGDLVNVFAIGNAQARPDKKTDEFLKESTILLNFDADNAGINELTWWNNHYPDSLPWLTPKGKDIGEAFKKGVNIREWVKAGIKSLKEKIDNKNTPVKFQDEWRPEKPEKINTPLETANVKNENNLSLETANSENTNNKSFHAEIDDHLEMESWNNPDKICAHNKPCLSLTIMKDERGNNRKVCLMGYNHYLSDLDSCPRGVWKRWKDKSGCIEQIILMPILKRRRY